MSATETKAMPWPTLNRVEAVLDSFKRAYTDLDRLDIAAFGLIDKDDPWEQKDGVPTPSLQDVAVLTRLVCELEGHMKGVEDWLDDFRQLRDSASTLEAYARGAAS